LSDLLQSDRPFVDIVRAFPDGREVRSTELHSLQDYFNSIHALHGAADAPFSLRLHFHRRPDAGRFWKDLMLRTLQDLRRVAPEASITRERASDARS
jgi:hypothetical protein